VTPVPTDVANGQPGTTPLRVLSVGSSHYIVPDTNRFKVRIDLQALLDGERTSLLPPDSVLGVLPAYGPRITARVQLVVSR
jgi:hypothetical protein